MVRQYDTHWNKANRAFDHACVPDTRVLETMQEADLQQRLDNYVLILLDCHCFVLTPSHLDEAFN